MARPSADRPDKPPGKSSRKIDIAPRYLLIPGNRTENPMI